MATDLSVGKASGRESVRRPASSDTIFSPRGLGVKMTKLLIIFSKVELCCPRDRSFDVLILRWREYVLVAGDVLRACTNPLWIVIARASHWMPLNVLLLRKITTDVYAANVCKPSGTLFICMASIQSTVIVFNQIHPYVQENSDCQPWRNSRQNHTLLSRDGNQYRCTLFRRRPDGQTCAAGSRSDPPHHKRAI